MEIRVRNVNEALDQGIFALRFAAPPPKRSRNGIVIEYPEPIITIYRCPWERVLLSPARDANPFLHFFEALWMLAGRNDLEFMLQFQKRFSEYSDDGKILQGAYGQRWRRFFGFDQLEEIVRQLRKDPNSRRATLQMWSASDLRRQYSKDLPCNVQCCFKIRDDKLWMTVFNRSNDMLWGAYGANAVHFSMLQEYVADKLGIHVGSMVQVSDSMHVYLEGPGGEVWRRMLESTDRINGYPGTQPLGAHGDYWDEDLATFFDYFDRSFVPRFTTTFFRDTVWPMWLAFHNRESAIAEEIVAPDWRKAAVEWLTRRSQKLSND